MNAIAPAQQFTAEKAAAIAEAVLIRGDLADLTPQERAKYCVKVCQSVGLNPLTRPFEYITLNGRLTLYARKDATDQLRAMYKISVTDLIESEREGVFIVTAKVANADGRTDAAKGAVTIIGLKGDALANALMKAETKAKRRATLSICGLGMLDETELETIPAAAKEAPRCRATDPTLVVWDKDEVRAPTYEEGHDHNEQLADDWGKVQGDRLVKAVRQTKPANDGPDIPEAFDRRKKSPKDTMLSEIESLNTPREILHFSLAMSASPTFSELSKEDRGAIHIALERRQKIVMGEAA